MKNTILTILILILGFTAKAQVTVTYYYDDLQRLTQANYSNGKAIVYSYDQLGNRLSEIKTSNLSVEDFENSKSFTLFPNPFQEELNISSKEQNISQVQLYDITGKLIQEEKVNNQNSFTLKTNDLPIGTYLVNIITDKGKETYKVIKK
jgi:YD repeat-containing protein